MGDAITPTDAPATMSEEERLAAEWAAEAAAMEASDLAPQPVSRAPVDRNTTRPVRWAREQLARWIPWAPALPEGDARGHGANLDPRIVDDICDDYARHCGAEVLTDPVLLPRDCVLGYRASWVPVPRGRYAPAQEHTLVVAGTDGRLRAVTETTPHAIDRDQSLILLRHTLRREGGVTSGPVSCLLPPAELQLYASALDRAVTVNVSELEKFFSGTYSRPVVAALEYRRLRAVGRRFLARLDPEIVSVLILTRVTDILEYNLYQAPETRRNRLQAARSFPLLMPLILRTPALLAAVDAGRPLVEALAAELAVPDALIRRPRGLSWRDVPLDWPQGPEPNSLAIFVRDLSALPVSSLPAGRRQWVPLLAARAAEAGYRDVIPHRPEVAPLLVQGRGKWAELVGPMLNGNFAPLFRIGSGSNIHRLKFIMDHAGDLVRAVRTNIVEPTAVLAVTEGLGCAPGEARLRLWRHDAELNALAAGMVYGTLSPARLLRRASECHAQPTLFRHYGQSFEWEPLWPVLTAPNGVTLVPLTTSDALADEGNAMRHCVAGYAWQCAMNGHHILSLRGASGGRLSTAEILRPDRPGAFVVRQHFGPGNSEPPSVATAALDWLAGEIAASEHGLDIAALDEVLAHRQFLQRVRESRGFDDEALHGIGRALKEWRPHLEKPWSKLTALDAVAELARRLLPLLRGEKEDG